MRPSPGIAWQIIDGEAILVDINGGRSLGLNATGTLIWKNLEKRADDIVTELVNEFEVPVETAKADVYDFLKVLRDRGYVSE